MSSTEVCIFPPAGSSPKTTAVSGNYTVLSTDEIVRVDASGGPITITMPTPTGPQQVTITKIDATGNEVTVVGNVNGVTNPKLATRFNSLTVIWTGTYWEKRYQV